MTGCVSPLTGFDMPNCRNLRTMTVNPAVLYHTYHGEVSNQTAQLNTCTSTVLTTWVCTSRRERAIDLCQFQILTVYLFCMLSKGRHCCRVNHSSPAELSYSGYSTLLPTISKNWSFNSDFFEGCSRARAIKDLSSNIKLKNYMRLFRCQ